MLVEEKEPQKEKGYVGALYGGIKRCLLDKHLHLQAKTDYIAHLIARAEPELLGNHRERHAKTLEIAQEEVSRIYHFVFRSNSISKLYCNNNACKLKVT